METHDEFCTMSFPWPVTDDELVLDDALAIAMRHFDLPSDEEEYAAVESFVGKAIMDDWRKNKVVVRQRMKMDPNLK